MTGSLVVSVSGIDAETLDSLRRLTAESDRRTVPLSLLVAPRRRTAQGLVLGWVADRTAGPDTAVLHGFEDSVAGPYRGRWPALEAASLPAHEAGLKLIAARAMLARFGLRTECFAPTRWLASPGVRSVLPGHGFRICAEMRGVRDLAKNAVCPGLVLPVGGGHRGDRWRSAAVVLGVSRAARRGALIRLHVNAADLDRSIVWRTLLDALDLALHHGARPTTYAALMGPMRPVQADRSAVVTASRCRVTVGPDDQDPPDSFAPVPDSCGVAWANSRVR